MFVCIFSELFNSWQSFYFAFAEKTIFKTNWYGEEKIAHILKNTMLNAKRLKHIFKLIFRLYHLFSFCYWVFWCITPFRQFQAKWLQRSSHCVYCMGNNRSLGLWTLNKHEQFWLSMQFTHGLIASRSHGTPNHCILKCTINNELNTCIRNNLRRFALWFVLLLN